MDLELIPSGPYWAHVIARSEAGRNALQEHLRVEFCKEWATRFGRAYDFCEDQILKGLSVKKRMIRREVDDGLKNSSPDKSSAR